MQLTARLGCVVAPCNWAKVLYRPLFSSEIAFVDCSLQPVAEGGMFLRASATDNCSIFETLSCVTTHPRKPFADSGSRLASKSIRRVAFSRVRRGGGGRPCSCSASTPRRSHLESLGSSSARDAGTEPKPLYPDPWATRPRRDIRSREQARIRERTETAASAASSRSSF
jgi:hypothetical protein